MIERKKQAPPVASARKIVVFPDIHFGLDIGNRVVEAVREVAIRSIEYIEPDDVVGLGDLLEGAAFSSHPPSSVEKAKARGFIEDEVEPALKFLDRIQAASKGRLKLLLGNHEFRVDRWCMQHGLSTADAMLMQPSRLLAFQADGQPRKKIDIVPYVGPFPHLLLAPNLLATHGWSYAVQALRKCLDIARSSSVVIGHIHRFQETALRNPLTNETYYGWSPGCLCTRTPDYRANLPTDWAWGLTQIYQSKRNPKDWTHYHIRIEEFNDSVRAIMLDGHAISVRVKR